MPNDSVHLFIINGRSKRTEVKISELDLTKIVNSLVAQGENDLANELWAANKV